MPRAWRPWFEFAAVEEKDFPKRGAVIAEEIATGSHAGKPVPAFVAQRFRDQKPKSLRDVAEIYQSAILDIERRADGQYPMAGLLCAMQESPGMFRKEYYRSPVSSAHIQGR